MHVPINVKSPNNVSKWQMGFNSAFKGLTVKKAGGKILAIHEMAEVERKMLATALLDGII
jgi:hypothetical protein